MNYDIRSNPTVGAGSSSPLDDSCAPVGARFGSAVSAVNAWIAAGMPASHIVLGVPAYGHSFVLPPSSRQNFTLTAFLEYNASLELPGDKWDDNGGLDVCGVFQGPGGTYTYLGLIEEGILNSDESARAGIDFLFDDCSQTPFLYNTTTGVYVAYDNTQSFAFKGGSIHTTALRGFAMWEAGGDFNDTLLDSILNATQNGRPTLTSKTPQAKSSQPASPSPSGSSCGPGTRPMWQTLLPATILLAWSSLR